MYIVIIYLTLVFFPTKKKTLGWKHLVNGWEPKQFLELDIDFRLNEIIYRNVPSSIHGIGLFSMDGIHAKYKGGFYLMECLGPYHSYGFWTKMDEYI